MKRYMLFASVLMVLSVLITGCSGSVDIDIHGDPQEYDVSMMDAVHTDAFSEDDKIVEEINFTLKNNEPFDLDCSVILSISNSTNSTSKKLHAGLLHPKDSKRVSLKFTMFDGDSDLKVVPACSRP